MKITSIRSEGLSHLSYFVSSNREAMVIDPRRDCDIYVELAAIEGADILYIFETHRNEDYVVGSLELQNLLPSAQIGHSAETNFKYGDYNLQDGDTFKLGSYRIEIVHTPGHTDDSLCYAVIDATVSDDPIFLFTGDTIFVNEVGRTDLVDIKNHGEMSRKLWYSLHDKVLSLGDGVIIYPGHGAGSVCGGAIGSRDFSTIGYERENNIWLEMDEEEFVKNKMSQNLTRAPYFKRCEKLNTEGAPLLADLDPLQMLNVDTFEELASNERNLVIDTRDASSFVSEHIPNSISMDLDNMGLYAGWVLSTENNHLLSLGSMVDLDEAAGMLYRVGIDTIRGYLNGGFQAWKEAEKETTSLPVYPAERVQLELATGALQLVDVRQHHETVGDSIQGSKFAPLTSLSSDISDFKDNVPIAAICPSGIRSTTGASILQRAGFNLAGITEIGLNEWKRRGLPTS